MRTRIALSVTPADLDRLCALVKDRDAAHKHVWRAQVVLRSAEGLGTNAIMRETGKSKTCVWRTRSPFHRARSCREQGGMPLASNPASISALRSAPTAWLAGQMSGKNSGPRTNADIRRKSWLLHSPGICAHWGSGRRSPYSKSQRLRPGPSKNCAKTRPFASRFGMTRPRSRSKAPMDSRQVS